jgi:hypothetical protein
MTMSLILPTMRQYPSSSIVARSPVRIQDLTVSIDNLDFKVGLYPSHRRNAQFERIVTTALKAHGTGFSHPIGDGYFAHVHGRSDFLHDLDGARSSRHDPPPKGAEIETRELRVIQLGNEHRRDPVEDVATFCLNGLQRPERIKGLGWIDHRCCMGHTTEVSHHHAKTMIQRHRNAHARTGLDPGRLSHKEGVVDQIMMRERGALRQSGGAAGELDVDGVIHLDGRRYRIEPLVAGSLALFQYPVERQAAVVLAGD